MSAPARRRKSSSPFWNSAASPATSPASAGRLAKAELLKGIVRKERIDPADAVMVGDATTDSDAAEAAETLFYGRGPFFENTAYPHGSDLTGLNRWLEELAGKE